MSSITYTVASPYTDVQMQAQCDNVTNDTTHDTIILYLPAATHVWAAQVNMTIPSQCTSFEWKGDGWDATIIQDNYNSTAATLQISGINAKFRWHDMRYSDGASFNNNKNPILRFNGVTTHFRMFAIKLVTSVGLQHWLSLIGWIRGVVDHCYFNPGGNTQLFFPEYGRSDGFGDAQWADPTPKNAYAINNLVMEDCYCYSGYNLTAELCDTDTAGTFVARFNDVYGSGFESHPTTGQRNRGGRFLEAYCNLVDGLTNPGVNFVWGYHQGGPLYAWGNNVVNFQYGYRLINHHRTYVSYPMTSPPNGWGWAGTGSDNYTFGNVSCSGTTVTKLSGNNWDLHSGLVAGAKINIDGTEYDIASVTDGTHLELTTSQTITNKPSYIVAHWDQNTDSYGYPVIDQCGRGQGDLLSGNFPSCINTNRSNHDWTFTDCHPHQALEPCYMWGDTITLAGGTYVNNVNGDIHVQNRDYFYDQESSVGVQVGTYAAMQASSPTTVNQAWWVTDRGSWRTAVPSKGVNTYSGVGTGQGQLWIWNGSSWEFNYEPLVYPHPEVTADNTPPSSNAILMGACLT